MGSDNADATAQGGSVEYFRLAIEAAPTGMLMVNASGTIVLVNAHFEKLFGYRRDELIGQPVEMLVPDRFRARHLSHRAGFFQNSQTRSMGAGRDLYGVRRDGSEVPIEIGLNPLRTPEGDFVLGSVADISDRKREERERDQLMLQLRLLNSELEERVRDRTSELSAALKEREVLLQEVHHRVKNNLQVISSLINMQMRTLDLGITRDALEECQNRVQAIALIHDQLYRSKDYSRVPFSDYARAVVSSVLRTAGVSIDLIVLETAIEPVALPVDKAIPCGLILNELVTNSVKHGFPDGRSGKICVELRRLAMDRLLLAVRDDGVGLPQGHDSQRAASMGLQLVRTLTEQLNGELRITGQAGASFELTFPAEKHSRP